MDSMLGIAGLASAKVTRSLHLSPGAGGGISQVGGEKTI